MNNPLGPSPFITVLKIEDLSIGKRQRSDHPDGHISELRDDILVNGLIHAPTASPDRALVAGYCRLHAIKGIKVPYRYGNATIEPGFIPVVLIPEGNPQVLFRIEAAENMRRKDLSPMDSARTIAQLHQMLVADNGPTWSRADTGAEVNSLRGNETRTPENNEREVSDSLLINSFKDDADVAKAKSRGEAVKIAKKKLEQQLMGGLGALAKPIDTDMKLVEGDCTERLYEFADYGQQFHGIVCDPPYGMDADKFGDQTSATGHQYEDDAATAIRIAGNILTLGYGLCKSDAHLYMFCDIRLWPTLTDVAKRAGWMPFATPLIWHKPGLGHAPQPGFFGRRYECILFAQKGNRKLAKSASDVFTYPSVKDKIYAAQKPTELLVDLLGLSFYPGEHVLDPCCGSGSIFKAAKIAKLKATGIELNPTAIGLSKAAIAGLSKGN